MVGLLAAMLAVNFSCRTCAYRVVGVLGASYTSRNLERDLKSISSRSPAFVTVSQGASGGTSSASVGPVSVVLY